MNARNVAASSSAALVPGAIIIGVGLLLSSVAGLRADRDHYRAEAAQPNPTRTVTAPPTVRPAPAGTTTVRAPDAGSTSASAAQPVSAAGSPRRPGSGGSSGSGASGPTAHPSPTSKPPGAGSSSTGGGVSVRLPLGVLPELGLDLTIGGSK